MKQDFIAFIASSTSKTARPASTDDALHLSTCCSVVSLQVWLKDLQKLAEYRKKLVGKASQRIHARIAKNGLEDAVATTNPPASARSDGKKSLFVAEDARAKAKVHL